MVQEKKHTYFVYIKSIAKKKINKYTLPYKDYHDFYKLQKTYTYFQKNTKKIHLFLFFFNKYIVDQMTNQKTSSLLKNEIFYKKEKTEKLVFLLGCLKSNN